ncbi:MAG: hypothetical protein HYS32_02440 [Candidatus Woesearchaeota archaeon]|nr:MAG: hypothetical protein HYS32_02440 [Candidatus Woesearchaeota archaeon]
MKNVLKKSKKELLKSSAEIWILLIIVLFSLIILLLPHILRSDSILPTSEPYYHIRIASMIQESGIPKIDPLSFGGRELITPIGSPLVLAYTDLLLDLGLKNTSILLSIVLGLLFILVFYLILNEFNLSKRARTFSSLCLTISPIFIYLFSVFNFHTIPIFLALFAFYLFLKEKRALCTIILSIIPFFSIFHTISILILFLFYILLKSKKDITWYLTTAPIVIVVSLIYYIPLFSQAFPRIVNIENIPFYKKIISGLGAEIGLSIFALILAFIGVISAWKRNVKYLLINLLALIVIILVIILYSQTLIYINLLVSVLAALGIIEIISRRWETNLIKNFTVWVLILGLLFSGISFANRISEDQPDKELIAGLQRLKEKSEPTDLVFSHYKKGHWVTSLAQRPVLMDPLLISPPDIKQINIDSQKLFYSKDLKSAMEIINKYGIDYIFITKDMKEGVVWTEEDEDLLLVLKLSNNFKAIYNREGIEIWRVENTTIS